MILNQQNLLSLHSLLHLSRTELILILLKLCEYIIIYYVEKSILWTNLSITQLLSENYFDDVKLNTVVFKVFWLQL